MEIVCSQDAQLNNGWNPEKSVPRDSRHWTHSWGLLHVGQEMSGMMNHKDFRGLGITITSKSCLPCLDHCPDAPGSPTSQSQRLIKGYGQFIHLDSGHKGKSTTKIGVFKGLGIIVTCQDSAWNSICVSHILDNFSIFWQPESCWIPKYKHIWTECFYSVNPIKSILLNMSSIKSGECGLHKIRFCRDM